MQQHRVVTTTEPLPHGAQGLPQRVIEYDADKDRQSRPMVVQEGFKAPLGIAVSRVPEFPHKAGRCGQ